MRIEYLLQYGALGASVLALIIDRRGVAKYVPVGLFASLYANLWCYVAMHFDWWSYPVRLFSIVDDINFTVNVIVVPVAAIIWIKHIPDTAGGKLLWAIIWTVGLTGVELVLERFTYIINYSNGYDWYFSLILWFFTWYIWAGYHKWQMAHILKIERNS